MEKILRYFIDDTNKKIDEIRNDIKDIDQRLADLQAFKVEMLSSARVTAFLMSSIFGLATFIGTIVTVYYTVKK